MFKAVARKALPLVPVLLCLAPVPSWAGDAPAPAAESFPQYEYDGSWPKLPIHEDWAIGLIGGIFVDDKDHVWVYHKPEAAASWALAKDKGTGMCCHAAPPVIEFDTEGNVVQAWGGPGEGYDWPSDEHGIYVDYKGNVWLGGSKAWKGTPEEPQDGMVLKFSHDGKFLMQIGGPGPSKGNSDPSQLSGAASIAVDPEANEVYIADGYGNRRVVVYDADTGEFKRMWGAYGKPPKDDERPPLDPDGPPPAEFSLVHSVRISNDGLVYVCDRRNNRLQVFKKDGTFVKEFFYDKETTNNGAIGNLAFWPDATQSILATNDAGNFRIRFIKRDTGEVLGYFGHFGTYGGEFDRNHEVALDSHGNMYISEDFRVQKFRVEGGPPLN